jgi:hypothetical protein
MGASVPIIPFAFVSEGIMKNLELLIGSIEPVEDDDFEARGFIPAIQRNMAGDLAVVGERLCDERVPQMLQAATEAMIEVRRKARKMNSMDRWAMTRLRWVSDWIRAQRLDQPTADEVRDAGLEYLPEAKAA